MNTNGTFTDMDELIDYLKSGGSVTRVSESKTNQFKISPGAIELASREWIADRLVMANGLDYTCSEDWKPAPNIKKYAPAIYRKKGHEWRVGSVLYSSKKECEEKFYGYLEIDEDWEVRWLGGTAYEIEIEDEVKS